MPSAISTWRKGAHSDPGYGIVDADEVKGGDFSVSDLTARAAIAAGQLVEGMTVYVVATGHYYKRLADNTWFDIGTTKGGGSGDLTKAQADTYYAALGHNHAGTYSPVGHDHAGVYSPVGHNHAGVYEPVIAVKNDAFNKLFGVTAGTVAEGSSLGDKSTLTTSSKTSLVTAVNEVNAKVYYGSLLEVTLMCHSDMKTTSDAVPIKGKVASITDSRMDEAGTVPASNAFTYSYRVSTSATWTTGQTLAQLNTALLNPADDTKVVWVKATNLVTSGASTVVLTINRIA